LILQENYYLGHIRPAPKCYVTQPLACSWGDFHFCHSF
jgi:hypothetical protein